MKDRVVEFPHRYQLVPVSGQSGTYDIIAKPGTVTEVGTPLNKATLLKDETAALYGLTGEDATVDEALKREAKKKTNVVYISTSQNWIVPDGASEVDVFLVDGGHDGETGPVGTSTTGDGGKGGDGGSCLYLTNVKVSAGDSIPIVIGARNGGTTKFGSIDSINITGATGGVGGKEAVDGGPGKFADINNFIKGHCPIDGNYYGVSGSGGGYGWRNSKTDVVLGVEGKAGLPPIGATKPVVASGTSSSGTRFHSCGGGASKDNDGEPALTKTGGGGVAPSGGDATSYGCGGGGGSGGVKDYVAPGPGGLGAPGGCIIAY